MAQAEHQIISSDHMLRNFALLLKPELSNQVPASRSIFWNFFSNRRFFRWDSALEEEDAPHYSSLE